MSAGALTVYRAVLATLLPLWLLRFAMRAWRDPAYRQRWTERLGYVEGETARRPLWIHAVSVGESNAALALVRALRARTPGLPVIVTTTTPTGAANVARRFPADVRHYFFPLDVSACIDRFLDRIKPRALILTESELWPNLIARCHSRRIPVALVNARLTARSARGYGRLRILATPMLRSLTAVAAREDADAARLAALGVSEDRIRQFGNLKFDLVERASSLPAEIREMKPAGATVIVAGSTHEPEEALALAAWRRLRLRFPGLVLVVAPRHPQRFEEVARLCATYEPAFARRSAGTRPGPTGGVLLVDSMGELEHFFGIADIALIGGTFVSVGGHNVLEGAVYGVPLIVGPSTFNFAAAVDALRRADALVQVEDSDSLENALEDWLSDPERRATAGRAAAGVVESGRGAAAAVAAWLDQLLGLSNG